MAGQDKRWCSRDLLWMIFDYAFNQCLARQMLTPVSTGNPNALEMDLRAGWKLIGMIPNAYSDGHMAILSMDRDACKWLKHTSKHYRSG
jgi:hypothetical protein